MQVAVEVSWDRNELHPGYHLEKSRPFSHDTGKSDCITTVEVSQDIVIQASRGILKRWSSNGRPPSCHSVRRGLMHFTVEVIWDKVCSSQQSHTWAGTEFFKSVELHSGDILEIGM